MLLSDYLKLHGLSQAAFGQRIGEPQQAVQRYASGQYIPRREAMLKIVEATGGAVTPNDFFGITESETVEQRPGAAA